MVDARTVVVSAVQFACSDSVSQNVDTAERLVRAACNKGANIILIQELFEGYYFYLSQREFLFQHAKPYKGHPTILRMQNLAKELGVVIPVSFFEEANNAHYNSVAVIDADGTDLGLYRKPHVPEGPGYQEKISLNHGDSSFKVFTTKFAKIGIAISWDQWFPEAARAMVLQGAEILLYPTAIGSEPQDGELDSIEHWKRVMQGHAGANLVPLIASNRVGKETLKTENGDSMITFYGNSFIAGPSGELVALANDNDEDILIAEFDLNKIKTQRHSWGVFRDRRPDSFKMENQSTAVHGTAKGTPQQMECRSDPRSAPVKEKRRRRGKAASGIKAKATWDSKSHQVFIDLCLKEARAGNKPTTYFSKKGWNNIISKFNKITRKDYDRLQLKNHWDVMKKEWLIWDTLVRGESGLGWDYENQTVAASEEWWENKIKQNPDVAKFRNKGLEQFRILDELFMDTTVTDARAWATNFLTLPSQGSEKSVTGDGYNDEDDEDEDDESEFDDSENATMENTNIMENINGEAVGGNVPVTSKMPRKRPNGKCSSHSPPNKKVSAVRELSKQIDRICDVMESISSATSARPDPPVFTIKSVINLLMAIPGMEIGSDLYNFACSLFMKREAREVFIAQPSQEAQLSWLSAERDRQRHRPPHPFV